MFGAIFVVCAFLTVGFLIMALSQRRLSLAARLWPTVPGVIRASVVESRTTGTGSQMAREFIARVKYDYDVGGHTYRGECISTGMPWSGTRTHPDLLVLQYAEGSEVQVHHHPEDRTRAVLRIHPRGAGTAAAITALVAFAACGAALLLAAHRAATTQL